METNH